jgi:hypothetical protein
MLQTQYFREFRSLLKASYGYSQMVFGAFEEGEGEGDCVDEDEDGNCDDGSGEDDCVDEDGDGYCDDGSGESGEDDCVDEDGDGYCDEEAAWTQAQPTSEQKVELYRMKVRGPRTQ